MKAIKKLVSNTLLLMVLFAVLILPVASMTLLKYKVGRGSVLSATSRFVEYRDNTTEVQNTYQETEESTRSYTNSVYQW
jgi:hypothetical protein